ncbi:MAG: 2-phospho-L-lactate transferase [Gammaproteobacteria bacterium]|nr:2-phospho-L-lactate transferase [Gammaproteobacteria bacterium]
MIKKKKILALSGGVGGAKLCRGLDQITDKDELVIIANTGDDFLYLGFYISPDIDTLIYTLAGENNIETGWGRTDETWKAHNVMGGLGADNWFKLGDKDLEMHVYRSKEIQNGTSLTEITQKVSKIWNINSKILPMSNHSIKTIIESDIGTLSFQEYFVKKQCIPKVESITFKHKKAKASQTLLDEMNDNNLTAIIFAPSNPYLSIDPILSLSEIKNFLRTTSTPVIAVSPVVDGQAVKGPTTKIMSELGVEPSAVSIAKHYDGLIDGLILDVLDQNLVSQVEDIGIRTKVMNTIMHNDQDKIELAQAALDFAQEIELGGE